jgi:hypothetical protein
MNPFLIEENILLFSMAVTNLSNLEYKSAYPHLQKIIDIFTASGPDAAAPETPQAIKLPITIY